MPLEALKHFDSQWEVIAAPVLAVLSVIQKKSSLGHTQDTVTEHVKQTSARHKPAFGQGISQGISPGPDQPCFHEPISKPYVKNSYWQEL